MRAPTASFVCAVFFATVLIAFPAAAADAEMYRLVGIQALKESQNNPAAIVPAAQAFAQASVLYEDAGRTDMATEMNSFLFWCKKKMTLADTEAFNRIDDKVLNARLENVTQTKVEPQDAEAWMKRANAYAAANPDEHFLIAARYFEVADRFKGTDISLMAQDLSLKEMQQVGAPALTEPPPRIVNPLGTIEPSTSAPSNTAPVPEVPAPAPVVRMPLPPAAKLKEAEALVKDTFKTEFASTKPDDRLALAERFVEQIGQTKDDPASTFILLREARDLSISAGRPETAIVAMQGLLTRFGLDAFNGLPPPPWQKIADLCNAELPARRFVDLSFATLDEIFATDQYSGAKALAAATEMVLPRTRSVELSAKARQRLAQANEAAIEWTTVKESYKALDENPKDGPASFAVGKFECFVKDDWKVGLLLLSQGDGDEKALAAKALAVKELANEAEPDARAAVADGWWEIAEKEKVTGRKARIRAHAAGIYQSVEKSMTGVRKIQVEKRIQEVQSVDASAAKAISDSMRQKSASDALASKSNEQMISEANMHIGEAYQKYAKVRPTTKSLELTNRERTQLDNLWRDVEIGKAKFLLPYREAMRADPEFLKHFQRANNIAFERFPKRH